MTNNTFVDVDECIRQGGNELCTYTDQSQPNFDECA